MQKKIFIAMALAGGLLLSPSQKADCQAQPVIPDRSVIDSITQGQTRDQTPPKPQNLPKAEKKQMKELEKAVKQNLGSAEYLMQIARDAGASPKTLQKMEKMSVDFIKAFLSAIAPEMMDQGTQAAPPAKPKPPKPAPAPQPDSQLMPPGKQQPPARPLPPNVAPCPRDCPYWNNFQGQQPKIQGKPAPRQPQVAPKPAPAPAQPQQPQGIIITAPDGTQWLVTPQMQQQVPARPAPAKPAPPKPQAPAKKAPSQPVWPAPQKPGFMQQQATPPPSTVAPQPDSVEEVIILEENVVPEMPLWPTKEQLGTDGVLKYLQKRAAQ